MAKHIINTKNFVSGFKKYCIEPSHALRETKQDFYLFAMKQASNGNFTFINHVATSDLDGDDRRAVNQYFEDHCDVKWDTSGKKYGNRNTKGFKYAEPEKKWWEYKPTPMESPFHIGAAVLNVIKSAKNAQAGKAKKYIEKGEVNSTKAMLAYLAGCPGLDKDKLKAILTA